MYVQDSEYFKRDGFDVYTTFDLTPAQAVIGGEFVIKTLEGEKTISVPAGCQCHDHITLKGAGIPQLGRSGQKGNHIVVFNVVTPNPKKLTEEEKQLYRRLYEINTGKKFQGGLLDKIKKAL